MSATLSTHVLDLGRGAPGAGITLALYALDGERRSRLAEAITNVDGRTDAPLATALAPGLYELVFEVGPYFARTATPTFFDTIPIRFRIDATGTRYHVPLLLSPWGYSTYRGS
ncbi:MAG TPA: hydroxyisourate hydrolase [Candidatus Limnocylindria bacterium]|nr:hydroxyisourate hydrolase [Candidatus Limnocylindria bacterium]